MNEQKNLTHKQKKIILFGLIAVAAFGCYDFSKAGIIFVILWLGISIGMVMTFAAAHNLIKDVSLKKAFLYIGLALTAISLIASIYFTVFVL